jgi:hypothetical protein
MGMGILSHPVTFMLTKRNPFQFSTSPVNQYPADVFRIYNRKSGIKTLIPETSILYI